MHRTRRPPGPGTGLYHLATQAPWRCRTAYSMSGRPRATDYSETPSEVASSWKREQNFNVIPVIIDAFESGLPASVSGLRSPTQDTRPQDEGARRDVPRPTGAGGRSCTRVSTG